MKNALFTFVFSLTCLWYIPVFSQTDKEPTALGLPGDNLDLYAVLALFQKSKTIEEFEKSLNSEKEGINNLDLNNDKKIDFIKVVTKKEKDNFTFILQDAVSKSETQDVAVILVSKDKDEKYSVQIVGDKELYGKDYIVEPIAASGSTVTPNPAYTGTKPVTTNQTVVVAASPVIVYLYSPIYVPYTPPYYYGFYPPYFNPWAPLFFAAYYHHNYYHHAYYQNTVIIHNSNYYSHYSTAYRHSSTTVIHYNQSGNYKGTYQGNNYARPSTLPSITTSRPSGQTKPVTRQTTNQPVNTKPNTQQRVNQANSVTRSANANLSSKRKR
jgi:hypothetical protein